MGKTWLCCFSPSNTSPCPAEGSQSIDPSHTPQAKPSIESIKNSIQEDNMAEHTDELIKMLDDLLSKIKGKREEASTSSGMEYLASATRSGSQVVDFVSKEAENINDSEIISQELGSVATRLLSAIGATHFIFLGLSLVASALERYLKKKDNDTACMDLLEELVILAKEVKKFKEAVCGESERAKEVIVEIVVGVVMCCDYIKRGSTSRYWVAGIMESQVQKTKKRLEEVRESLILTATAYIAGQIPKRSVPCPLELLDIQPEGIEDQVADVKKLLDIGGSEEAIAVVIVGFGGIGKRTLADSVIQSLDLPSTDFKFSMVRIDQKTPDRTSHILKLQSYIIFHFTGNVLDLQDTRQGQQKLQAAIAGKSCFIYIDNVVDSYYIKELLPRGLLPQKQSKENSQNQMPKTKIRVLVTSRQNDLKPLFDIKNFVHDFQMISNHTAEKILSRTILQGDIPARNFDEERMINELAEACKSVPLLLSIFGNHLKDARDEDNYKNAIQAMKDGNIEGYNIGDEEFLSKKFLFVYDQLRDEEAKKAFLDICTYFHGWEWNRVADIVDSAILATLDNKKLVNKSKMSTLIVHDILRLMGAEKAKNTRLMNYKDFYDVKDDESKLRSVEGMVLLDRTFLATVETRHLNAMRHSLRFLVLGDWVRVDGPPSGEAFKKLRYLEVGDLKDFPFKDVSKMEKLNVFCNSSKPGMELHQLPHSLKNITYNISHPDCNEFASLPLKHLKSLKQFSLQTRRSVRQLRLPQGFKLPGWLEHLKLNSCEQLPEAFGHLSGLQSLSLDYCDFKCLPQGFTQSAQLRSLSLQHCTNMISLRDNTFASLCSLRDLDLRGCTRLEELPGDLGTLTALKNLNINKCENLGLLPESFGGLRSIKTLVLDGCNSLQRLPDSFGMLCIESLTLESLDSLKELPPNIGGLSHLQRLKIISCPSLESVPDSFVHLTNLNYLKVGNCPRLIRLPDGFEGLKSVKCMELENCSTAVDLPASFEMLSCLEELYLVDLPFSRLPNGLGKLKRFKILLVAYCTKFQTLPQDFENLVAMESLGLLGCRMLEGTTMERIVKLQNCHYVEIDGSTKLMERWNELKEENKNLHMIVKTSGTLDQEYEKEMDRARTVGLFCGKCIQLDSTTNEFIHHSSLSIPNNTTIAVISLQLDQPQLFRRAVDMANKRATTECAGELAFIYVCRRNHDSPDAPNEEEETRKIRQALTILPPGISYAIPSTDIRRLSLIGRTIFNNPNVLNDGTGPKFLCFMVKVREDDEGHQILKNGKLVTEYKISKASGEKLPISEISDEKIEISDGIVEFMNLICESRTESPSRQCSRLPEENMAGEFIRKLKNNNIHYFSDNKVKVDHLQGKTVAIILIDRNYPECTRLREIYHEIKQKDSNFEAVWIPLPEKQDLGFGTYSRAIQGMPWLTLADPKLIKVDHIKDKIPRVIIINSGGSIGNPNALSLLMSWGADAYPFKKESLGQLNLKSSLEFLFHSTLIKELNNKLTFLYSEPPDENLKMKRSLEKLVQIHGECKFDIVYVGRFSVGNEVAEGFQKTYEDAIQSMSWAKLSFLEMIAFWYRCKYLSDEETHEEPNSESTLSRLVEALLNEERWLVVVDGHGMVTARGIDVVEMACQSSDDDEVGIRMREELRESLREGKCSEGVMRYFRDELNHPEHLHPLRVPCPESREEECACDRCGVRFVYSRYGKRIYACLDCNWGICWDCRKEFLKEEVTIQVTQEG